MNEDHSDAPLEMRRLQARRLISELDATEFFALAGLARGMSSRDIAAASGRGLEEMERTLASLMKKLDARTIADAVRIAIYANLSSPH